MKEPVQDKGGTTEPRAEREGVSFLSTLRGLVPRQSGQDLVARNAIWVLLGQGGNFFLQAAYFILVARLLGVTEYGLFVGAFALVNILAPYSALGSGMLFMRYVTADRSAAAAYWGNTLLLTTCATVILTFGFYFAGPHIIEVKSGILFALLAVSSCLFTQITLVASQVFQTLERMSVTAALMLLAYLARVVVVIAMIAMLHHATAVQWAFGSLIASAIAAAVAIAWVMREVRGIKFEPRLIGNRALEGLGFAFAGTTTVVYNDIDKAMLSHYGLNRENGFYTLAYRIVDFATAPLASLEVAVLPRYFHLSRKGFRQVSGLVAKCVGISVVGGLVIALVVRLASPIIPLLVGRQFAEAIMVLRWLCWIPLLRGIHMLTGGALTGSGYQWARTGMQLVVALTNVGLNLWWIPRYGWVGAARSSVISDGLLAVLNMTVLVLISRKVTLGFQNTEPVVDEL